MTPTTIALISALACTLLAAPLAGRSGRPINERGSPRRSLTATRSWITTGSRRLGRRRPPTPSTVAAWCDEVARLVRRGETLRAALQRAVPGEATLRDSTEVLRRSLERGRGEVDALENALGDVRPGAIHLRTALVVFSVAARVGGSAAPAIERTATSLRLRAADDEQRTAHSAAARLSARLMSAVPVGVLVLLTVADRRLIAALASPAGAASVTVGLLLNLVGVLWMRSLIRGDRSRGGG